MRRSIVRRTSSYGSYEGDRGGDRVGVGLTVGGVGVVRSDVGGVGVARCEVGGVGGARVGVDAT